MAMNLARTGTKNLGENKVKPENEKGIIVTF